MPGWATYVYVDTDQGVRHSYGGHVTSIERTSLLLIAFFFSIGQGSVPFLPMPFLAVVATMRVSGGLVVAAAAAMA